MTDNVKRRDVLKGLGGFALASVAGGARNASAAVNNSAIIAAVPNRPIVPPANANSSASRVYGYAQKAVTAGASVDFRIKSDVPYDLSVVRLGWDRFAASPRDWNIASFPPSPAQSVQIYPGSYIHVENALAGQFSQLTCECWVRLAAPGWRGLISQYSYPDTCGFGIFVDDQWRVHAYFGNGGSYVASWDIFGSSPIPVNAWCHIAAVFANGSCTIYLNGNQYLAASGLPTSVITGGAPLRLGAYGSNGATDGFLTGDIAMPVIYGRALTQQEVLARASLALGPPQPSTDVAVLGCWPLTEESGYQVADVSAYQRPGVIVNHGTWMVGGPGFNASLVGRFDTTHNPTNYAARGHGLRLSASDLYDCNWPVTHSFTLPAEAIPGIYVGRLSSNGVKLFDITFVVRSAASSERQAPLLVVCSTSTWLAYNREFNLFSLYDPHPSGQFSYHSGLKMPWSSADPYLLYGGNGYSHLVGAERHLHVWLEQMGIGFDVIPDSEVSASTLSAYKVVLVAGHSEYWTKTACDALKGYIGAGGKLISASGNTMCWRVTYDSETMEARRKLPGGTENTWFGEQYHEHDKLSGGSLREAGTPAWQITGLDTIGYGNSNSTSFNAYTAKLPNHVFLQSPEVSGVSSVSPVFGTNAVGHEYDVRIVNIPSGISTTPTPSNYSPQVIADVGGSGVWAGETALNHDLEPISGYVGIKSEIIDWPQSGGGRVFSIGSINVGRTLHDDPKFSMMFRNALHHLGLATRLNLLSIGTDGRVKYKSFDGQVWSPSVTGWLNHGDSFTGASLAGIQASPSTLSLMSIMSSGQFFYRFWHAGAWSTWGDMSDGVVFKGTPDCVSSGRNQLHIFARSSSNQMYWKWWNGSVWQAWTSLGAAASSDPAAVIWHGRNPSVAFLTSSGSVEYMYRTDQGWGTQNFGGSFSKAPTMYWWDGRLYIFAVTATGTVQVMYWTGTAWTGWISLGGTLASRVKVCAVADGLNNTTATVLHVFGIDTAGKLRLLRTQLTPSTNTAAWQDLGSGGTNLTLTGEPSVTAYRGGHISVVARTTNNTVRHRLFTLQSNIWQGWQNMGSNLVAAPIIFRSFTTF
jgi:N,N-dimethylformamidase